MTHPFAAEGMPLYFGQPDRAPVYDDATQVDTPVGDPCARCDELIEEGDQGFLRPHIELVEDSESYEKFKSTLRPIHRVCDLRTVLGSLAHQRKECWCFTKSHEAEDNYLAVYGKRREAELAVEEFYANMDAGSDRA